jgi:sec-independent protein translocase protein TatA
MPNIGPLEIVVVLVIALLVLGPNRLPDFGRSVGHGLREFKSVLSGGGEQEEKPFPAEERELELDERERRLDERERDLARRG